MIYLDYNATTPIDPAVTEAMLPFLTTHYGNPSSLHALGQVTKAAITKARQQVADCINAIPEEIIFTGGGTEATNLAIKGYLWPILFGEAGSAGCLTGTMQGKFTSRLRSLFRTVVTKIHIVTSTFEHPATLRCCQQMEQLGCKVTYVPVDSSGLLRMDVFELAMQQRPTLVTIMHSNNEVGTIQPIAEISKLASQTNALVHTDVAQSMGKVKIDVEELGVDFLTIAGHKLYAPKGVGALWIRRFLRPKISPQIHGAGHELGQRAGTENVPYIVGIGKACEIASSQLPAATSKLQELRDALWTGLKKKLGDKIVLNGHETYRLPNTLNVSFLGHIGSELLAKLPEIAASTGSACHEGMVHISPVLEAMNIPKEVAQGAVRLTVGRYSTMEEINEAVRIFVNCLH